MTRLELAASTTPSSSAHPAHQFIQLISSSCHVILTKCVDLIGGVFLVIIDKLRIKPHAPSRGIVGEEEINGLRCMQYLAGAIADPLQATAYRPVNGAG